MKEAIATLTSKGQVTIPVEIRRHLGLAEGDKIAFVIGEDGVVKVGPVRFPTVASLVGAAGSLPEPLDWREMRRIARETRRMQHDDVQ